MKDRVRLVSPVLACLFAALIVMGAFVQLPLPGTPVPIYLGNLFVILAALILGPVWGTTSVALYVALGALGLPVFSQGHSGLAALMGPTGGFIIGYLPAALAMGLLSRLAKPSWPLFLLAAAAGEILLYAIGVPWLKFSLSIGWTKAFLAACLPFLPGDALKVALAVPLAARLGPWLEDYRGKRG